MVPPYYYVAVAPQRAAYLTNTQPVHILCHLYMSSFVIDSGPAIDIGGVEAEKFNGLLNHFDSGREGRKYLNVVVGFSEEGELLLTGTEDSSEPQPATVADHAAIAEYFGEVLQVAQQDVREKFGVTRGVISISAVNYPVLPKAEHFINEWHTDAPRVPGCRLLAGYVMRNRIPLTKVAIGRIPLEDFGSTGTPNVAQTGPNGLPLGMTGLQILDPLRIWRLPQSTVHNGGTNDTDSVIYDSVFVKANFMLSRI
jgi:hypothetical protein